MEARFTGEAILPSHRREWQSHSRAGPPHRSQRGQSLHPCSPLVPERQSWSRSAVKEGRSDGSRSARACSIRRILHACAVLADTRSIAAHHARLLLGAIRSLVRIGQIQTAWRPLSSTQIGHRDRRVHSHPVVRSCSWWERRGAPVKWLLVLVRGCSSTAASLSSRRTELLCASRCLRDQPASRSSYQLMAIGYPQLSFVLHPRHPS